MDRSPGKTTALRATFPLFHHPATGRTHLSLKSRKTAQQASVAALESFKCGQKRLDTPWDFINIWGTQTASVCATRTAIPAKSLPMGLRGLSSRGDAAEEDCRS
jgi:hypothetical protein